MELTPSRSSRGGAASRWLRTVFAPSALAYSPRPRAESAGTVPHRAGDSPSRRQPAPAPMIGAAPRLVASGSCSLEGKNGGGKEVRGPRGAEENGGGGVVLRPPRVASPCGAAAFLTSPPAERRLSDRGGGGAAPAMHFLLRESRAQRSSRSADRRGLHDPPSSILHPRPRFMGNFTHPPSPPPVACPATSPTLARICVT